MGSGLIYAVIVAGWAALLAPRWIRRNDEIARAQEADAARGVRVLERRQGRVRGGHVSASAHMLGRTAFADHAPTGRPVTAEHAPHAPEQASGAAPHRAEYAPHALEQASGAAPHRPKRAQRPSAEAPSGDGAGGSQRDGALRPGRDRPARPRRASAAPSSAAARRRRVFALLLLAHAGVGTAAVTGQIAMTWLAVPPAILVLFVLAARRAVVRERHRARILRHLALRRQQAEPPAKRVAVLDDRDRDAPFDRDAWTPVPVPRPTYLRKPRAEPRSRAIDLSSPGAWTSGRLDTDGEGDGRWHAVAD